ncbi:MAG: hypothetical protein ACRDJ1_08895 [Actinomycetota bacterium]
MLVRTRLLVVVLLLTALAAVSPANAVTGPTIARLEVTISSTSSWASVSITPGRVAAWRLSAPVPADVTLTSFAQGWVLTSKVPGSWRTVKLRAAFEETTGSPIRVTVQKGYNGKSVVDVRNTSQSSFQAAYVFNQLPIASTGTKGSAPYSLYVTRTRAQFFGSVGPALTHADPQKLVLAAFYPWFHASSYGAWQHSDRPLDPRSTLEYQGVLSMTAQARSAGVDGFIVSWAGEEYSGWRFDMALSAAEATGGYVVPYIEMMETPTLSTGKADPAVTIDWIADALTRSSSPAFLHSGGVPVVFVFGMPRLTAWGWNNVLTELNARGTPVRLVGDATLNSNYGAVQWGMHQYHPNFMSPATLTQWNRGTMLDARLLATSDATGPHLVVATVSPGYNDTRFRGPGNPIVERGAAGERYLATWDAAVAGDPDWIMVTSWNEWFEGTHIEPSVLYGDLALRQTAERAALFSP